MRQRVKRAGLEVAGELADFVESRGAAGNRASLPRRFWRGFAALVADLAPRNRALLATRDRMQAEIDAWTAGNGAPRDIAAARAFLADIGYLVAGGAGLRGDDGRRRPRDRRDLRAAARGAGDERALRAERGQRPLGLALRRALRHRRDPGDRGPCARRRLQPGARRRGDRLGADVPRRGGAARRRLVGGRRRHRGRRRTAADDGSAARCRSKRPEQFAGHAESEDGGATECFSSTTASASRSWSTPSRISAGPTGRASRRQPRGGADLYHGLRGFGRCRRRRGQDARLPQLARPDEGRPEGDVPEGRRNRGAQALRRLHLYGSGWLAVPRKVPFADAGAQRRAPDDEPGDPRRRGPRGPRGDHGCDAHGHDRAPRRRRPRAAGELAGGLGLHRQAEDARAGGGRLRGRALRPGRGGARHAAEHAQGRDHGRGAPDHAEPQGKHPRGARAGGLHQHGLPRPYRRRDPHRDGGRAGDPEGRDEAGRLVQGLRGLERRYRARLRPAGAGADRQGDVGGAGPDGGDAGREGRAAGGGRQHRLGAVADGGDAARDALPPGARARGAGAARRGGGRGSRTS